MGRHNTREGRVPFFATSPQPSTELQVVLHLGFATEALTGGMINTYSRLSIDGNDDKSQ